MTPMITLAAISSALLGSAPAHGQKVLQQLDGSHAQYRQELRGDVIRLDGMLLESREPFQLEVRRDGSVNGWIGASSVSYSVGKQVRDAAVEVIRREKMASLVVAAKD